MSRWAHVWGDSFELDCEEDVEEKDREQEVLGEIFGGLDHYELVDADHSGDGVYVCDEALHTFSLDLPFPPSDGWSAAQLRHLTYGSSTDRGIPASSSRGY